VAAEETGPDAPQSAGLLASLRKLAATVVGTLQTRFELIATEIDEERLRILELLLLGSAALFLLMLGVLLLTLFVVVLFWDSYRVPVILGLAVTFLGAGAALAVAARGKARRSRAFSATLSELSKDRKELEIR
jgi:uncharacterized membrane protein YqjE